MSRALSAPTFRDIGDDAENHAIMLTGTGNEFCAQITADGFDFFTPTGYDKILGEGTKVFDNILAIQVPMIDRTLGGRRTVGGGPQLLDPPPSRAEAQRAAVRRRHLTLSTIHSAKG